MENTKEKLKFNLQLFGNEKDSNPKETNKEGQENQKPEDVANKTYTHAELEELLQKEGDKRVSEAYKKLEEKFKEKLKKELEVQLQEAKRLADLSAEEREKELARKNAERVEELEKELKRRDLEMDTLAELERNKLPASFKQFLIGEDAESTNKNIKAFKEVFDAELEKIKKENLAGTTPKSGGSSLKNNPFKKETFNLTEQGRLYRENPILAEQLRKEAEQK